MESVRQVLMRRDGLTCDEAQDLITEFEIELEELIELDGSLCEAEDLLADHFGLEPDYLMEFL